VVDRTQKSRKTLGIGESAMGNKIEEKYKAADHKYHKWATVQLVR